MTASREFNLEAFAANANGRVAKMRKAVPETVAAFLKQVTADEIRCHFNRKRLQCAAFSVNATSIDLFARECS